MIPVTHPRIKICCIQDPAEARLAVEAGASVLGLVSDMPSGPGVISDSTIREIRSRIPPPVATFLLTSRTDVHEIIDQYHMFLPSGIQLVDRMEPDRIRELRNHLRAAWLIPVVHIRDHTSISEAQSLAEYAHAILLDSGQPDLSTKILGGTGKTHDWEISRRIRESVPVPVFLAGGLTPRNVGEAVNTVRPFAVDVCSGVRTGNKLDPIKLAEFCKSVSYV